MSDVEHTAQTEQRIAHIADMMRRWEWKRGKSGPALAERWGLSLSRVEHLAAEASRRVKAEVTDPDRVSMTVGTALAKVVEDAIGDDDRKSVIDASKAWAQIVGAMAPQRHEIAASEATPAKAAELVRQAFGRVTPEAQDDDAPAAGDASDGAAGE